MGRGFILDDFDEDEVHLGDVLEGLHKTGQLAMLFGERLTSLVLLSSHFTTSLGASVCTMVGVNQLCTVC